MIVKPISFADAIEDRGYVPSLNREVYSTGFSCLDERIKLAKGFLMVVSGYPSMGKALAVDTPIPTPNGWTTMGGLNVGDAIYDDLGNICNVVKATEVMFDHKCYEITFSCGTKVVCDEDHKWVTRDDKARMSEGNARRRSLIPRINKSGNDQTYKKSYPSAKTTKEISKSLFVGGRRNHFVSMCKPVEGNNNVYLPVPPYTFGAWLGDGRSDYASITCFDEEIIKRIADDGFVITKQAIEGQYGITNGLVGKLRTMNVLGNKRIPDEYLIAPEHLRRELLKGLMDTDGHIDKNSNCEFCSKSPYLAYSVKDLACSLGLRASVYVGRAMLNGKDYGSKYRVRFHSNGQEIFHLKRKQAFSKASKRLNHRSIISCVPVDSVPVRCIQVDSGSHQYLCTESYIPTHNTEFMDAVAVNMAVQPTRWNTLIFSPENGGTESHMMRLAEKFIGKREDAFTKEDYRVALKWLDAHFTWMEHVDPTLDNVIKDAIVIAETQYLDMLIIDPWNEIMHKKNGEMIHDYLANALMRFKQFARKHNVLVCIVAHPKQTLKDKDGCYPMPELYDIADGTMWRNKCDYGVIVHRPDMSKNQAMVSVQKLKFKYMGRYMSPVLMDYDREVSGRFKALGDEAFLLPEISPF
jgi:hypothetical protein